MCVCVCLCVCVCVCARARARARVFMCVRASRSQAAIALCACWRLCAGVQKGHHVCACVCVCALASSLKTGTVRTTQRERGHNAQDEPRDIQEALSVRDDIVRRDVNGRLHFPCPTRRKLLLAHFAPVGRPRGARICPTAIALLHELCRARLDSRHKLSDVRLCGEYSDRHAGPSRRQRALHHGRGGRLVCSGTGAWGAVARGSKRGAQIRKLVRAVLCIIQKHARGATTSATQRWVLGGLLEHAPRTHGHVVCVCVCARLRRFL